MNLKPPICISLLAIAFAQSVAQARLGDTETQSQARYGAPISEPASPDAPLVTGVKDTVYNFQGWRIRAAFVGGVTVRIEYVHLQEDGIRKPITDPEVVAILEAERGTQRWRESKDKPTGDIGKDIGAAIASAIVPKAKIWERPGATATLKPGNTALVLELPAAVAYEKKQQQSKTPSVPKF